MMTELHITVLPNGQYLHIGCCMCGSTFELKDPQPSLTDANGDRFAVEEMGDICPDCFDTLAVYGSHALADEVEQKIEAWAASERQRIEDVVASAQVTAALLRSATVTIHRRMEQLQDEAQ